MFSAEILKDCLGMPETAFTGKLEPDFERAQLARRLRKGVISEAMRQIL